MRYTHAVWCLQVASKLDVWPLDVVYEYTSGAFYRFTGLGTYVRLR